MAGKAVRLRRGDAVWVRDEDVVWVEGVLVGRRQGGKRRGGGDGAGDDALVVEVGGPGGEQRAVDARTDCEVRLVRRVEDLREVEDLTALPALQEPALLATLHERFLADRVYTFSGRVLLALNPYKAVKGAYGPALIKQYFEAHASQVLRPHIYAVASRAYRGVLEDDGVNQTILVSGESGAGKTESTKILMQSIAEMSQIREGGIKQVRFNLKPRGPGNSASPAHAAPGPDVSDRVLQSNPILEAFGNAGTIRNDNSSRFGKLIQMKFRRDQVTLQGAYVTSYLLEKSRVIHQGVGERSYHIFYAMGAGGTEEQMASWRMHDLASFDYLTQKDGLDHLHTDAVRLDTLLEAMRVLGIPADEVDLLLQVVAGVLHMGNLDFVDAEAGTAAMGSRIAPDNKSMSACVAVCDLLKLNADALERALCKRVIRVQTSVGNLTTQYSKRKEESFEKGVSCNEARSARDALAMALYERTFGWLVWRINQLLLKDFEAFQEPGSPPSSFGSPVSTNGTAGLTRAQRRSLLAQTLSGRRSVSRSEMDAESSDEGCGAEGTGRVQTAGENPVDQLPLVRDFEIGVLDVFGFEVFEENGFEQLCINYCNERLQQLFNEYVFLKDQEEYDAEGIEWEFIRFPDNKATLDMIESRPIGLVALIDENCLLSQGNDAAMCNKLYSHLPREFKRFLAPTKRQRANHRFTLQHFAGKVTYSADGFTRKNKNELRQEAVLLVNSSQHPIVKILLPDEAGAAAGGVDLASYFDWRAATASSGSSPASASSAGSANARKKARSISGRFFGKVASAMTPTSRRVPLHAASVDGRTSPQGVLRQKTVLSFFKTQLERALDGIRTSQTHYIRCIKPNDENEAGHCNRHRIVEQLRYSGVMQVIQVARMGYPTRITFGQFVVRFCVLSRSKIPLMAKRFVDRSAKETLKRETKEILRRASLQKDADFQLGHTKVFLRQRAFTALEVAKDQILAAKARVIQRAYRDFLYWTQLSNAATTMQALVRGALARLRFADLKNRRHIAAQMIQLAFLQFQSRKRKREKERRSRRRGIRSRSKGKTSSRRTRSAPPVKRVTFDLEHVHVQHYEPDAATYKIRRRNSNPELSRMASSGSGKAGTDALDASAPAPKQKSNRASVANAIANGNAILERLDARDDKVAHTKSAVKHRRKQGKSKPQRQQQGDSNGETHKGKSKRLPKSSSGSESDSSSSSSGSGDSSSDSSGDSSGSSSSSESDSESSSASAKKKKRKGARSKGSRMSAKRVALAAVGFLVLIPLVIGLGGVDSSLSYLTAAVMALWIFSMVFADAGGEPDADGDAAEPDKGKEPKARESKSKELKAKETKSKDLKAKSDKHQPKQRPQAQAPKTRRAPSAPNGRSGGKRPQRASTPMPKPRHRDRVPSPSPTPEAAPKTAKKLAAGAKRSKSKNSSR